MVALIGMHADTFAALVPAMERQVSKEIAARTQLRVALRVIADEAPAVQLALAERLREIAPDAYAYGVQFPEAVPMGSREFFRAA
jgi:hypothetical protein